MAISITEFTANKDAINITFSTLNTVTAASIMMVDSTVVDVLSLIQPEGTADTYKITLPGNFSDGVFTFTIDDGVVNHYTICNLLIGTQALLYKTIKSDFDCTLLLQLDACQTLVLSGEGDLAREIYVDVLFKSANCLTSPMYSFNIHWISIHIIGGSFVVV